MNSAAIELWRLAKVIRSKNAGPFQVTVDVLFRSSDDYERVKRSNAVTSAAVADAYRMPLDRVVGVFFWDAALAMKVTFVRTASAGGPKDSDCYGAQQHAPLMTLLIV